MIKPPLRRLFRSIPASRPAIKAPLPSYPHLTGQCVKRRAARGIVSLIAALVLGCAFPIPASAAEQTLTASADVHALEHWIASAHDNEGLPFIIVDKVSATIHVFDGKRKLLGSAPALLGLERGDGTVAGIGSRPLKSIKPSERTTPAGRFKASLGHDLVQDILWVDYESALSLHRVVVGSKTDHRFDRLASATPLDNRISFGCINVPAAFYDAIVAPAFKATMGVVYILPETQPLTAIFAMTAQAAPTTLAAR